MLLRAEFRAIVVEQLKLLIPALRNNVFENRALPVEPKNLPLVSVSTPRDAKTSMARGAPKFTSVFNVQIDLRVTDQTDDLVAKRAELLIEQIELATLANKAVVNLCQQFVTVTTEMRVELSGGAPIATATMVLQPEVPQFYDPAMPDVLAQIEIFGPRGEPKHQLAKIELPPPLEKR